MTTSKVFKPIFFAIALDSQANPKIGLYVTHNPDSRKGAYQWERIGTI